MLVTRATAFQVSVLPDGGVKVRARHPFPVSAVALTSLPVTVPFVTGVGLDCIVNATVPATRVIKPPQLIQVSFLPGEV